MSMPTHRRLRRIEASVTPGKTAASHPADRGVEAAELDGVEEVGDRQSGLSATGDNVDEVGKKGAKQWWQQVAHDQGGLARPTGHRRRRGARSHRR
jgi:hypothetical protein